MKVWVDAEKCQGHNRCYALAPELFDVDDYGQAVVIGDGDGAAGAGGEGAARRRQLPGVRDQHRRLSADDATDVHRTGGHLRAGRRLGHRHRPRRPDLQPACATRSGPSSASRAARSPTPTGTAACGRRSPHELVREIAYDTEHFTSRGRRRQHRRHRIAEAPDRRGAADHQRPAVPPPRPAAAAAAVRAEADRAVGARGAGAVHPAPRRPGRDHARRDASSTPPRSTPQHIPVNVIARMLGFPLEDDDLFREFVHHTLEGVNLEPRGASAELRASSTPTSTRRSRSTVEHPRDDLTSYLLDVELDGQKLSPEHVRGSIVLLLLAGIDTTWSAIGSSHLAPRHAPRRPPPPRRRTGADADGDRGVPARLRAGHDGAAWSPRTTTSTAAR